MYVNVKLIHLGVREVVVENADGGHTVFIDDRLSRDEQVNAFEHAMRHINEGDFDKHGNVNEIEAKRHKKPGAGTPGASNCWGNNMNQR